MCPRRHILIFSIALVAGLCAFRGDIARAQRIDIDPERATLVKAAYLVKFIEYTNWPTKSFEKDDSPIVISVLGDCGIDAVLNEVVRKAGPVSGRRIVVNRIRYPVAGRDGMVSRNELEAFDQSLRKTHLLYVCSLEQDRMRAVLRRVKEMDVLTVSDLPRFAENGGMLGFVINKDRMVFQANPGEIQKTGIVVSAKVLKIAEIVESRET